MTPSSKNPELRSLTHEEIDAVAGARVRAVIVFGDCTTNPRDFTDFGVPVIIFNPWITPGTPERAGQVPL
ncbi:MAG: hypothetical protein ABS54_09345 [Hyphomicrobium sp. SCN 65-11]|jgi:hypothetical protein|nr:MAG: hypothetical protein ABS54_09345 [Hyphomicrobium sp. SCN 65-11]